MKNLKFYYGRDFTLSNYASVLLCSISIPNMLIRDMKKPGIHTVAIYFDIAFLAFFLFFISYTFINTYVKNRAKKVALELTENEIVDVGGNRNILWSEVYNLVLEKGKIKVIFKDEKRESLTFSMRKIKGDAFDNYNIMYDYMEALEKLRDKEDAINALPLYTSQSPL
ncbi:hypothetical protein IDJ77_15855 [Mucilaginibacter sp. ZT4R22]|uniref:PH (Pleckstrin Homology) domain-containing protein n=1 Tax=Mucilaginibacter pankratovii TaxID=2772110 RepID=A0ABR7WSK2_9SPHI|nr:hypothetical protein [Mucilaginibacter pankratovii]MBD1365291.1 hypothetical protein [Mucilaginibacter pankratovii]